LYSKNNPKIWHRLDLTREDEFERWVKLSNDLPDPGRPRRLYSEPLWLAGKNRTNIERLAVYENRCALATFIIGPTSLPIYMGEIKVGELKFQRASLSDFRVDAGGNNVEDLLENVLWLAKNEFGDDIVFHIETHELGFFKVLNVLKESKFGRHWLWLDHDQHVHHLIHFENSFDHYFSSLSSNTRRNIKKCKKKITSDFSDTPELVRVTESDQVEEFLYCAQQVSQKTYQCKMLGKGLYKTEAVCASNRFAADKGWLRSYLFYIQKKPVAFIEGFQYAGTYQGWHHGSDPALSKYSIGMLLWVAALSDLYGWNKPDWFDFGSGDAFYKQKLSNTTISGVNNYLWPLTWKNKIRVESYRTFIGFNRFASKMAEQFKLKARLKRFFRKRA